VKKEPWPELADSHPHPRVFGKSIRRVRKHDRIRVDWPDGAGTHDVDDFLDRDRQFKESKDGWPAPSTGTLLKLWGL
jgi:hypothetical protein